MNIKQPLALKLADKLEQQFPIGSAQGYLDGEAAAELRRLQAENAKLREALSHISTTVNMHSQELHIARAALARAGEKT